LQIQIRFAEPSASQSRRQVATLALGPLANVPGRIPSSGTRGFLKEQVGSWGNRWVAVRGLPFLVSNKPRRLRRDDGAWSRSRESGVVLSAGGGVWRSARQRPAGRAPRARGSASRRSEHYQGWSCRCCSVRRRTGAE